MAEISSEPTWFNELTGKPLEPGDLGEIISADGKVYKKVKIDKDFFEDVKALSINELFELLDEDTKKGVLKFAEIPERIELEDTMKEFIVNFEEHGKEKEEIVIATTFSNAEKTFRKKHQDVVIKNITLTLEA